MQTEQKSGIDFVKTEAKEDRRGFIRLLAGCTTLVVGATALETGCAKPEVEDAKEVQLLGEGDRIDIGNQGDAIIQKAYELGKDYDEKYGNCAQCTLAALQDAVDFVPADGNVFLATSGLGGSATPDRSGSCGAFTGAGMAIGTVCGRSRANFSGKVALPGELMHELHAKFAEAYGSIICAQVREKGGNNCPEVVGNSARWTAEIMLRRFTNYEKV